MNAATATTASRTRQPVLDAVCAEAVELALAAAEDVAGIGEVGRHLGVVADGDRVVTHLFECRDRAYRGWNWAVTLTRAPRTKFVTLDETVLVSGEGAVQSPEWVPWSERLRPGDLGVGDLLPVGEDDARLVPAYTGEDEQEPKPYREITRDTVPLVGYELGLGRPRVLSRLGREEAAERWHEGEFGPHSAMAQAAPAHCSGCGFLAAIGGMLGQAFGVCANEYSPSDGRVVSLDYGCGAHSEAAIVPATHPTSEPVIDEYSYDTVVLHDGGSVAAEAEDADADAGAEIDEAADAVLFAEHVVVPVDGAESAEITEITVIAEVAEVAEGHAEAAAADAEPIDPELAGTVVKTQD